MYKILFLDGQLHADTGHQSALRKEYRGGVQGTEEYRGQSPKGPGDPLPLPTSISVTIDYSVCAGFTWMDVLTGFLHMLLDFVIQLVLNYIVGALSGLLKAGLGKLLGKSIVPSLRDVLNPKYFFKDIMDGFRSLSLRPLSMRNVISQLGFLKNNFLLATIDSGAAMTMGKEIANSFLNVFVSDNIGGPLGGAYPYSPYQYLGVDDWF